VRGADRRVVSYDRFRVVESAGRIDLFSQQVGFECPPSVSYTHFRLDSDWCPRRVTWRGEGFIAGFEFTDHRARMSFGPPEDAAHRELEIPVDRSRAIVFGAGLLCAPFLALRRYDSSNPEPQEFNLLPTGRCLIRRAARDEARSLRREPLEMQVSSPGSV